MKKSIRMAAVFLAAAFLLNSCASTGNETAKTEIGLEPVVIEKVEKEIGGITISTSPVYEAMGILCSLSGVIKSDYYNTDFKNATDTWFSRFQNHDSVKVFSSMAKKYSLTLDDFFSLSNIIKDDFTGFTMTPAEVPYTVNKAWEKAEPYKLLAALNKFVRETKYEKFYLLHRSDYIYMQNGFADCLEDGTIEKFISEIYFSGKPLHMNLQVSEAFNGYVLFYGLGEDFNGYDYHVCYGPYVSKDWYFQVLRHLSSAIVNPQLRFIEESTFKDLEDMVNKIRQANGYDVIKNPDEIKYRLLDDIVLLNSIIYCRDYDKKEDFDLIVNNYTQNYGKEIINELQEKVDEYLSVEVSHRDFLSFMKKVEVEFDKKLYEIIVSRI